MATKKKVTQRKNRELKKAKAASKKSLAAPQAALQTIEVHPRLANAISSLKRLVPEELERLRGLSSKALAEGTQSTGCWISDTGGQQHCMNLPPDVCTREGGISVPTRCPNS